MDEHKCERCGAKFYYSPSVHRCPGEWEAVAGPAPANPYAGMAWEDECVAKVKGGDA